MHLSNGPPGGGGTGEAVLRWVFALDFGGEFFGVRFFKVKCCDEITRLWGNKVTSEGVRCFYLKWFFEWRIFMKLGQLFVDLFGNRRQEKICLQ